MVAPVLSLIETVPTPEVVGKETVMAEMDSVPAEVWKEKESTAV